MNEAVKVRYEKDAADKLSDMINTVAGLSNSEIVVLKLESISQ